MATHRRPPAPAVIDELLADGTRFEFVQAVRLLGLLAEDAVPLAEGVTPWDEAVRLRAATSLQFPASEVADVKAGEPPELTVAFFGLLGALGPLPQPLTEWLLDRLHRKDTGPRDFLDLFHHRLLAICYRILSAHRLSLATDSPAELPMADYLLALMGLGTEGLRDRMAVPDRALLRYTGLLNKTPRDAAGLETLLADHFGVPVECTQLIGALRAFSEDQWTHIGSVPGSGDGPEALGGTNHVLGQTAILGCAVWDQHAGVRITVGPVNWERYLDFLPGRPGFRALCHLSRFFVGPARDLHLRLLVSPTYVPQLGLRTERGSQLGFTSFLGGGGRSAAPLCVELPTVHQYCPEPESSPGQPLAGAGNVPKSI